MRRRIFIRSNLDTLLIILGVIWIFWAVFQLWSHSQ